ncbi:hypothetical protein [Acinetobacter larvae]|uniref:Uncharacterized protein n=1 Tax=Acinetobacter larvae TaxID=1789224 RepID=A0A1B2M1N7_9GAMM|nr:hypothetical protein [Acinetobacter larvae]AOA59079.1 hypothetical protein BFG52_12445 [Acinetobacter larvae]
MSHPQIEQLIDAHLAFLTDCFAQDNTVHDEFLAFYQWFKQQALQDIWQFPDIFALLKAQILQRPASDSLIQQISTHIHFALCHPLNHDTTVQDILPVLTIDKIARYVADKSQHRQKLIQRIVQQPAFTTMLSQVIHQSIQEYIDNTIVNKKVPGVGRFMKMGKSVFESVTDSNIDDTVRNYLQKNLLRISELSEKIINQHLDDERLYHLQASLWHKIKGLPLSTLQDYICLEDLPHTVALGHEIWDYLRQSEYLAQQLHDGAYTWYVRNQEKPMASILNDLNIDDNLVAEQLSPLLQPIFAQMLQQSYLQQRARHYLSQFYYAESTLDLLSQLDLTARDQQHSS